MIGRYVVQPDGAVKPDPEVTFLRASGRWTPLTYQSGDIHRSAVQTKRGGYLKGVPGVHAKLIRLTDLWMRRVDAQLRLRHKARPK